MVPVPDGSSDVGPAVGAFEDGHVAAQQHLPRRESDAWQEKMWGLLQNSYMHDGKTGAHQHQQQQGLFARGTGADSLPELRFEQPTEEVLREWEFRRQVGSPRSPEPWSSPEPRNSELAPAGKWLQDLKSGLMHRRVPAQVVHQPSVHDLQHPQADSVLGPVPYTAHGPEGETWRWVARLAHLPVHELEADETVALTQLLREGLSELTRLPQASIAVVVSPGGADSSLASAYLHGTSSAMLRLLEDELWHLQEKLPPQKRLASSPALLRASDGRLSVVDARLSRVTPEDGYANTEHIKGILDIVRTHDSVLGLDAGTLQPDSSLLLGASKPSLAQALSCGTALSDNQASAERLEQHLWQLSSEYEGMIAMALERRAIANPDAAGQGANLAAVRKACAGLQPEGITSSMAEVLAPAAAREVEVAQMGQAVEDAKVDVASATRRMQLLAEECGSLHSELSHYRSQAALQLEQLRLRQSIASLEADLADQGSVESRLQLECNNLEAQTLHSTNKAASLRAEVEQLRRQLNPRPSIASIEERSYEQRHSHEGAVAIDDLQQLRADIAKLRAKVTPRRPGSDARI